MKRESFLLVLSGFLFIYGAATPNILGILLGSGLLMYIIYLENSFDPSIDISIDYPKEVEVGRSYRMSLLISSASDLRIRLKFNSPKWVKIEDINWIEVKSGRIRRLEASFSIERVGNHEIDVRIRIEDPLGLYYEERDLDSLRITSIPSTEGIRKMYHKKKELKLLESMVLKMAGYRESVDFMALREFQSGDDFKRMDWKATARLTKFIVREFMREEDNEVYLIVDASSEMRKGFPMSRFDIASILTLRISKGLISSGQRVGMIIFDERGVREVIKPSRLMSSIDRMRNILNVEPVSGKPSSSAYLSRRALIVFKRLMRRIPNKSLCKLVSQIRNPSLLVYISDLVGQSAEIYLAMVNAMHHHKNLLIALNPVYFYFGELDESTLEKLYKDLDNWKSTKDKFRAVAQVIEITPSDLMVMGSWWG